MNLKINQKYLLLTLSGLLMIGIVFSAVQIVKAVSATLGITSNPGHPWSQIQDFNCGAGNYLQSLASGVLTCGVPTDSRIGTLTSGDWCTTNGSQINCTSSASSGGISACYDYSVTTSGTAIPVNGCNGANTNMCSNYSSGTFMTGGGCLCLEAQYGEVIMQQNYGVGSGGSGYWVCSCCRTAGSGDIQTTAHIICCK